MRLAKLTVNGFKSFADRTEFTFDHLITGIVGPNGCGKSNVVDAIKWVLGERSSKSLRGHEMIDVIFAGSAARKPSGMASVSLTFENPVLDASSLPEKRLNAEVAEGAEGEEEAQSLLSPSTVPLDPADSEVMSQSLSTNVSVSSPPSASSAISVLTSSSPRRGLNYDADMVEIERRLYRDGESAYLINGKNARLKDIREMFLDTGVGADAYSIIEQGKVDAMLLASPQERRVIFEEAAGIAKYKQRRIEAQRKLERTQTNLVQTREQLENTERRLRLVRGQAAKARRFVELDASLTAWRMALAFDQYDDLVQRLAGLTSRQADLAGQRDAAGAALSRAEADKQEADLTRSELGDMHKRLEHERLGAVHAEQQAAQRRAMLERAVEEAQRQTGVDRARMAEVQQRQQATEASVADQRESLAAAAEGLAEAERRLAQAGLQRAAVLEQLNELRQQASQKHAAAARIDRERISLTASLAADAKRVEGVREQMEGVARKAASLDADAGKARDGIAHAAEALRQGSEKVKELEWELARLEEEVGRLSADRRIRTEQAKAIEQELVRLDSRRATLEEMVQTRAGFAESVRTVLKRREAGEGFAGITAPLADLIETRPDVDADAAAAVELALGADLQGLVVETASGLPAPEELAMLPGRVTFLPMVAGGGSGMPIPSVDLGSAGFSLDNAGGRLVSLRALVRTREGDRADPRLQDLLDRLLGRAYLVTDLDAALLLAAGPLHGQRARFVTRDGMVLDAQGRVQAGRGQGEETGLLRRRAELESLRQAVTDLRTTLEGERTLLREVDAEAGSLSTQAGATRQSLGQQQRVVMQEQNRLERAQADAARMEREQKTLTQESAQLTERMEKLEADAGRVRERAESLGRLHQEESAAASGLDAEVAGIAQRAEQAAEQMTSAKVEVGTLSEQAAGARRELARLELARDELGRQARDLGSHLERLESRLAEHAAAIEQCAVQMHEAAASAATLQTQAAEALAGLRAAEQTATALGEQVLLSRQRFSVLERDWHSLEVSRRELEVKRENLEERTQEEIGVDLPRDYPEYRIVMAGGDVARIDTSEAALQIDVLKDAVKKLGSVNLESMEEEKTLETQNETLVKQVADIDSARVQLEQLIEQLNEVSRERFGEVFTKIQQNFGGEGGMFRKLFGGGKAEVRLMPLFKEVEQPDGTMHKVETDQTDLLESGIEVIAKPPGKEPRSISQLSGGEKTLTAVALLMSIFRSKPSCFCVLDEVDAALDEGNVVRFNHVIREYTDRSRFIVITHNKRTMQGADRLYGVTMQERGVSTRVSVRFDEVGKDGHIRAGRADLQAAAGADALNTHAISESKGGLKAGLAAMREGAAAPVG